MEHATNSNCDLEIDAASTAIEPSSSSIRDDAGSDESLNQQNKSVRNAAATWTNFQKWRVISAACLITFSVGINSTAILSGVDQIAEEFNIDSEQFDYSFFLVTAWNGGAAVAPMVILPMMEDFGYLPIYYTLYLLFLIFVAVQAVAPNFVTLIVSRVIAGSCAGVLQNAPDGINADAWADNVHNRAMSLTFYVFCLLGGVTIGPAIGGAIIKSRGWRWILYVQLIISGVVLFYVALFLREPRSRDQSAGKQGRTKRLLTSLNETSLRAFRLLFTEFVIGTFTLLSSFSFGTVLIMTQSIPQVFSALYSWPAWLTGVVQIAIFVGEMIGCGLCIFQDKFVYPRFAYRRSRSNEPNQEARLYTVIPCCFLALTTGFFVYGWTAYPSISWALPALGMLLIGIGIMVIISAVSIYVTDCYVTHANSAISGVAFGENIFAAFLPLATKSMYGNLGFHWASSLLGFIALLLSIAPVVIVFYGDRIRAKSKFAD